MKILKTEFRQCPSCMEEHEVETVEIIEDDDTYTYEHCSLTGELWATEEMMRANKAVYRKTHPNYDRAFQPITISAEAAEKLCQMYEEEEKKMLAEDEARRERHKNDPPPTKEEIQKSMKKLIKMAREKDINYVRKERDNLRRRLFLCKRDNRTDKDKLKNEISRAEKFNISDDHLWDVHYYLALQILPILKRFKVVAHDKSCPLVCDEDLHDKKNEDAWDDIMDAMIYSFEEIADDTKNMPSDFDEARKYDRKIQKGFEYFGKYFQTLWI